MRSSTSSCAPHTVHVLTCEDRAKLFRNTLVRVDRKCCIWLALSNRRRGPFSVLSIGSASFGRPVTAFDLREAPQEGRSCCGRRPSRSMPTRLLDRPENHQPVGWRNRPAYYEYNSGYYCATLIFILSCSSKDFRGLNVFDQGTCLYLSLCVSLSFRLLSLAPCVLLFYMSTVLCGKGQGVGGLSRMLLGHPFVMV